MALPQPDPDDPHLKTRIRESYERFARWYDMTEGVLDWLLVRKHRRAMLARAGGRVLEVAVGTGVNLPHYPRGVALDAVDLSPAMLARARRKAGRLGMTATFHEMDAENLTFPDAHFDTVVSTLSTCTFPDPSAALREMARVLRPGGKVLLIEHGLSDRGWLARFQQRRADRHFASLCCRWDREPPALLDALGWRMADHDRTLLGMLHRMEAQPHPAG